MSRLEKAMRNTLDFTLDLVLVGAGMSLWMEYIDRSYNQKILAQNSTNAPYHSSQGIESLISGNPRYIYALTNERPTSIPQNYYVYIPKEAIACKEEDLKVSPIVVEYDSTDSIIFPITRAQDPTIIEMSLNQMPQPKFNYVPKFLSTAITRAKPPYHLRI